MSFYTVVQQALNRLTWGLNVATITGEAIDYPAANLQCLPTMGFTYVRIPVLIDRIVAGTPGNQTYVSTQADVDAAMQMLNQQVDQFIRMGLAVTVCPFYTNGVAALPLAQSTPIFIQAIMALVTSLNWAPGGQVFFELLNEPQMTTDQWNGVFPQLIAAARPLAPLATFIVDSAHNAIPTNVPAIVPSADQNVIYAMHCYQPAALTGEGQNGQPVDPTYLFPRPATGGTVTEWTAAHLVSYITPAVKWARANNAPIIMNEFGVSALGDPQSIVNWLSLMRQIQWANGVPSAFWGYYHLFPPALAGLAPAPTYDPVAFTMLGNGYTAINFGVPLT